MKVHAASNNESSAGALVALFQPDYGKFATIASNANQPTFPANMLLIGGDTTFMRKVFYRWRVMYGSTTTSSVSTSASTYEITNFGLKSGYGVDLSFIDFKNRFLFGIGELKFHNSQWFSEWQYNCGLLILEPFLMLVFLAGEILKLV